MFHPATAAEKSSAAATHARADCSRRPRRPFRNLVYAPGLFTGYGAKTLPGVREAIEERRFPDAELYVERTATALRAYADRLDQARNVLVAGRDPRS